MAENPTFPAKTISKILDLSLARVGQLAKAGIITRDSNGRYRISVVTEYIQFLREDKGVVEGEIGVSGKNLTKLIDEERYRKLKRENDMEDDLVAPVEILEMAIKDAGRQIIPLLDTLPVEMKRDNPELTGADIQIAKMSIAKCRNLISNLELNLKYDN